MAEKMQVLQDLGLSEGEAKVYLALLKLGSSNVHEIKEEANIHRTTVYDFVDKLIDKGLVSYVMKNGVRYFKANDVAKLKDYVEEKGEKLNAILPQLHKLQSFVKEDFFVEVHEGREGFKYWLNLILRENQELFCLGIEEEAFDRQYHYELENFFRKELAQGGKEKVLVKKGTKFTYQYPHLEYRCLSEEFFSPMAMMVFADYVTFQNFENDATIVIKSKSLASAHKKHFLHLWKMAEPMKTR